MRNLKKFLALVLAMMMVFSLMITVNAATSSDTKYATAYNVLGRYGVVKGTGGSKDNYAGTFTRAEMAGIAYRIATGDVDDKYVKQNEIYAMQFDDADDAAWAKGYIGYCANMGIVIGDGRGHFNPNDPVTGYQVAVLMLRLLGYTYKHEFEGKNWEKEAGDYALKTGISKDLEKSVDLKNVARRDVAIQMAYAASLQVERKAFSTLSNDYYNTGDTLIVELTSTPTDDVWGNPTVTYTARFTRPDYPVVVNRPTTVEPLKVYWAPVTPCVVSDDTGLDDVNLITYTNGKTNVGSQYIDDLNTTQYIGAQGRETRVYSDRIVYRDTVLVQVNNVTQPIYDVAGHEIVAGSATATVFGNANMQGIPSVNITNVPGTFETNDAYGISGSYAQWQMLTAHVLTGNDGSGTYNVIDGATFPLGTHTVRDTAAATPVPVTVAAIEYNTSGSPDPVGFRGTNGQLYLYSVSYGFYGDGTPRDNVAAVVLNNRDIGKTFNVYTDGRNNVLGIVPSTGDTGIGVITDIQPIQQYTSSGYVYGLELTVKTTAGNDIKIKTAGGTNATGLTQSTPQAVTDTASQPFAERRLVSYSSNTSLAGYYNVTMAAAATPDGVSWDGNPTSTNIPTGHVIEAGDATALKADGTALIDDSTIFFVETYRMSNSQDVTYGSWVTTGFALYDKGFKTIRDMWWDGQKVFHDGADTSASDLSYAKIGNVVLILNATGSRANKVETVAKYAYLPKAGNAYDTYEDYYLYNVLINGRSSTLKLDKITAANNITAAGLYIYDEPENGIYQEITGPVNKLDAAWAIVGNGVINNGGNDVTGGFNGDSTNAAHDKYLTLANNVTIYIVNPTTGVSYPTNVNLQTIYNVYGGGRIDGRPASDIYFQLDQYGWINFLYVVDNMTGGTAGTSTKLDDLTLTAPASPTANAYVDGVSAFSASVTTPAGVTVTVKSVQWQMADDTGAFTINVPAGAVYVSGKTYRAVVTLEFDGTSDSYYIAPGASGTALTTCSYLSATSVYSDPITVS